VGGFGKAAAEPPHSTLGSVVVSLWMLRDRARCAARGEGRKGIDGGAGRMIRQLQTKTPGAFAGCGENVRRYFEI
jgi:hypothetical protein